MDRVASLMLSTERIIRSCVVIVELDIGACCRLLPSFCAVIEICSIFRVSAVVSWFCAVAV